MASDRLCLAPAACVVMWPQEFVSMLRKLRRAAGADRTQLLVEHVGMKVDHERDVGVSHCGVLFRPRLVLSGWNPSIPPLAAFACPAYKASSDLPIEGLRHAAQSPSAR